MVTLQHDPSAARTSTGQVRSLIHDAKASLAATCFGNAQIYVLSMIITKEQRAGPLVAKAARPKCWHDWEGLLGSNFPTASFDGDTEHGQELGANVVGQGWNHICLLAISKGSCTQRASHDPRKQRKTATSRRHRQSRFQFVSLK